MGQMVKNLQELRDLLHELKVCEMESLVENLEELTPFQQGEFSGGIALIEEIDNILRNSLKYQDVVE